ncbi:MAG: hypothetical protein MUP68_07040, partial [Deltaproteobacteria bacterium]|nr:hypothetical protein [Deltaproteobacteria bacterium]
LNPSCPPFKKGRNSPLWKRGVRGDFGKICLVNYGLISKYSVAEIHSVLAKFSVFPHRLHRGRLIIS